MKRSEINRYIAEALEFWEGHGFITLPYARWSVADWQAHAKDCKEIFDLQIGWDVTCFGNNDFTHATKETMFHKSHVSHRSHHAVCGTERLFSSVFSLVQISVIFLQGRDHKDGEFKTCFCIGSTQSRVTAMQMCAGII